MLKVDSLVNVFSPARSQVMSGKHLFGVAEEPKPLLLYAAIAINAALLLSYLLGVNAQASTGYEIRQLQKKAEVLTEEQKALNLQLSEITAISALNQDFSNSGFVQAGAPKFVTVDAQTDTAMK